MPKSTSHTNRHLPRGMFILHEDRDILVVNKPAGLLTMGTDREQVNTAYRALTDYVRKGNPKSHNRLFIVHRLDRDVSGVLLFAKTAEAKMQLQGHWEDTDKRYLTVVRGQMPQNEATISSYLTENKECIAFSTKDTVRGKLSHTAYTVRAVGGGFSLLEIRLLTGRKNQIRVHLAEAGHPIVGDDKYGKKDPTHKKLALHALSIAFAHPYTGRPMTIESTAPDFLYQLVGMSGKPSRPDTP